MSERILYFQSSIPSLEEADNRMVIGYPHTRLDTDQQTENILVRSLDSDVVVILVGFFFQFLAYNED